MPHEYQSGWQHVTDAIALNARRGRAYAAMTGGKSRALTRTLIVFERFCLVPLVLFDLWGRKYNRQGVPVVAADFVAMSAIKELTAPLRLNGQATATDLRSLRNGIKAYRKSVLRATARGEFQEASRLTFELLQFLHELEDRSRSLFPMTRHILESIGNAALNAVTYAAQSNGRTVRLSKTFVVAHILGLGVTVGIDKKAQACHALGAGIVENDVPHIPFEDAWRRHLAETLRMDAHRKA